VDQVDKQFVPFVKPVFVGSTVRFPNAQYPTTKSIHFSRKEIRIALVRPVRNAPPVVFDKPGVVVPAATSHDWMIGYIYVSETPFFAKTGPLGTVSITECPRATTR